MGRKLVMTTINQIRIEVEKSQRIKENKKGKYIKQLKILHTKYEDIEIDDNLKSSISN